MLTRASSIIAGNTKSGQLSTYTLSSTGQVTSVQNPDVLVSAFVSAGLTTTTSITTISITSSLAAPTTSTASFAITGNSFAVMSVVVGTQA